MAKKIKEKKVSEREQKNKGRWRIEMKRRLKAATARKKLYF